MRKIKQFVWVTKKQMIAGGIGLVLLMGSSLILSQYPPSARDIYSKYMELESQKKGLGSEYLARFDGKGLFGKLELKRLDEMVLIVQGNINNLQQELDTIKVTDVKIEQNKYSGYDNIVIKVKNNGDTTINYVKLDLYYKDKNNNIVKSEWTNDASPIKPGATQKIEKMTDKDDSWNAVTVEVGDFR